jgi:hypothetical protein
LNFLIVKPEPADVTAEFTHIIRKTLDSKDWLTNGLRVLSGRHYQDDFDVTELSEQDEAHQTTCWHNHSFNAGESTSAGFGA